MGRGDTASVYEIHVMPPFHHAITDDSVFELHPQVGTVKQTGATVEAEQFDVVADGVRIGLVCYADGAPINLIGRADEYELEIIRREVAKLKPGTNTIRNGPGHADFPQPKTEQRESPIVDEHGRHVLVTEDIWDE